MRTPAFTAPSPVPLRRRHHPHAKSKKAFPRLTADPSTRAPIKKPPPPSPLSPSSDLLSTSLTSALYKLFSRALEPASALPLPDTAVWRNPLFDLAAPEIPPAFTSFLSFAVDPTITIYNLDHSANSFDWVLSFNYPLPWRPRVSIAGKTTTDNLETPTNITDEWYVHPISLIAQALPTIPDLIWLYPGPHAETDDGLRKLLLRTSHYKLEAFSPRAEIRVIGRTEKYEKELMFATPALPEQAFEGGLRRREKYAAVSPIALREVSGDICEWAVPVPGGKTGSSDALLPAPGGEDVRVEVVDQRIMATVRFGGFAMRAIVEEKVAAVLEALKKDGVEVPRDRVWVRVYNSKVGFNERGLLAMAMYGSSTGIPRRNEIAVDLTGLVTEDFWKR